MSKYDKILRRKLNIDKYKIYQIIKRSTLLIEVITNTNVKI